MDTEDAVSRHYSNPSLEELIVAKLLEAGKDPDAFQQGILAPVEIISRLHDRNRSQEAFS